MKKKSEEMTKNSKEHQEELAKKLRQRDIDFEGLM
jgi:hypothetical protein